MENEKNPPESDTQKTETANLAKEQEKTAALPEVSEVRIDIEHGTITLKLAEKK
jgi:hypothetical protein